MEIFQRGFNASSKYVIVFLIFYLAICNSISYGQVNNEIGLPFITNFSPKEYKAHPQNWDATQDSNGIIYFGNALGLLEYDGVEWNLIKNDALSLVRSLDIDSENRIYVGGASEIGYYLRDSTNQLQYTTLSQYIPEEYQEFNDVWTVHSTNNGVYFQAREYIFRLTLVKDNSGIAWKADTWIPDEAYLYAFYLDDTYFVHQRGIGLMKMNGDDLQVIPGSEVLGNDRMNVMLPFHQVGNSNQEERKYLLGQFSNGFYTLQGDQVIPFESEINNIAQEFFVYKGAKIADNEFVLSTMGNGIVIINDNGEVIQKLDKTLGLFDNSVYSFFVDKNITVWMGMDNGLSRIEFDSPLTIFAESHGINSSVLSIQRHDGILYLGTTNGLFFLNQNTGLFEYIPSIPSNQIFTLIQVGDELIVPSDGIYSIRNGKITTIRPSIAGEFQVSSLHSSKYHPEIFFAGLQNGVGVFRLFENSSNEHYWKYLGKIPGISDNVWNFAEAKDGTVWVGTQNKRIWSITNLNFEDWSKLLDDIQIRKYDSSSGVPESNSAPFLLDGEVIFAYASGLYRYVKEEDTFVIDSTLLGSESSLGMGGEPTEYSFAQDNLGRLWLNFGKETGLAIPGDDGSYEILKTPFLPFADDAAVDIYTESNGITWFATFAGLIRYDAAIAKDYSKKFEVIIRSINTEDQILPIESSTFSDQKLKYGNNTLLFKYSSPFYERESNTLYQTYLEGFNKTWTNWQKLSQKEYTSLSEGKYKFHVRAKNLYDQISEETVYHFQILPPWYRTWWAYLLMSIAGITAIYLIIKRRTGQLKKRSLELENEISERTKEIQERIEELSVINNVQKGLVEKMDINSIYTLVGDQLQELFDANTLVIRTFDREKDIEVFNYAVEKGERLKIHDRSLDKFARHLMESKEPILIRNGFKEFIRKYSEDDSLEGEMPKSAIFTPMIVDDKVVGNISLQHVDKEDAFTDADVNLLSTLANSMSIALENARLFDRANHLLVVSEKRAEELLVINKVQEGLVEQIDRQGIFEFIGTSLQEIVDAQSIIISSFDHEHEIEYFNYATKSNQPFSIPPRSYDNFTRHIINNRKSIMVNSDFEAFIGKYITQKELTWEFPKSAIFVPIIEGNKVVGNVSLQNLNKENAYTESEVTLLDTVVNSVSVALENARLFEETERRAAEMSTVNTVSQALTSNLDLDELFQVIGDKLQELFNADIVYIAMLDQITNIINFPYNYGEELTPMNYGEGLTSQIISGQKSQLINKDVEGKHQELGIERIGVAATSYLGVPIFSGNEVIGVLSVQSTQETDRFTESDMHLLETIASNVGIAIHNAQLFKDAEESKAMAEDANEAKSAFLSTVSHELRTPLTSVLGFAKIIKKRLETRIFPIIETEDPKILKTINQVSDNLDVVVSEGQRLTKLINEVLDLAKIEAGKIDWNMEQIEVEDVVERAISATTSLFDAKDLLLSREIDESLPSIIGDKDKLIQVVVNLISNAVKFTDEGTVQIKISKNDEEIIVAIKDSGIGIAQDDLSKVFEKFKQVGDTLTDKPKGTGLGLPISKEIVEHHEGRIWVESVLGEGTTFSFTLPITKEQSSSTKTFGLDELIDQIEHKFSPITTNGAATGKTILVVDDEEHIRELLSQELGTAGNIIKTATNGREALEVIRAEKIDLVILDVMMPEMNGFDVAAVLKNDPETKEIPIIILSAVNDKNRGYGIGIDAYHTKPIDMDALKNDIQNLLGQGKSKNRVMVIDEDASTINTLRNVLEKKGYLATEANGKDAIAQAIIDKPDIVIIKSTLNQNQEKIKSLKMEKGMEDVLFLVYE